MFDTTLEKGCPLFPEAKAQGIRFWTIGLTPSDRRHTQNVPFLGEHFWHHTVLELLTPEVDPNWPKGAHILF